MSLSFYPLFLSVFMYGALCPQARHLLSYCWTSWEGRVQSTVFPSPSIESNWSQSTGHYLQRAIIHIVTFAFDPATPPDHWGLEKPEQTASNLHCSLYNQYYRVPWGPFAKQAQGKKKKKKSITEPTTRLSHSYVSWVMCNKNVEWRLTTSLSPITMKLFSILFWNRIILFEKV